MVCSIWTRAGEVRDVISTELSSMLYENLCPESRPPESESNTPSVVNVLSYPRFIIRFRDDKQEQISGNKIQNRSHKDTKPAFSI